MSGRARAAAFLTAIPLLAAACTGGGSPKPSPHLPPTASSRSGGTLRVETSQRYPLDPTDYNNVSWEMFRCCLLRTLLSYNGRPTDQHGSTVYPDLAARMPEVSTEGLTWTFEVKRGIHYAPPLEDTEITAREPGPRPDRSAPRAGPGLRVRAARRGSRHGTDQA